MTVKYPSGNMSRLCWLAMDLPKYLAIAIAFYMNDDSHSYIIIAFRAKLEDGKIRCLWLIRVVEKKST